MAARKFLPRCIVFYNRIPIDSSMIPNSNTMHLGKNTGGGGSSIVKVPGDVSPTRVYFLGLLV